MPNGLAKDDIVNDPAIRFAGLTGTFGNWARFGVIGVTTGLLCWMVMWSNPSMQKAHLEAIEKIQAAAAAEIKAERDAARSDTEKSRLHGTNAAEKLAEASIKTTDKLATVIEKSTEAIVELKFALREEQQASRETLKEEQTKTRDNNTRLNELRMKTEKDKP